MDWLVAFLKQAFCDYEMMFVDVLTYCDKTECFIKGNKAFIKICSSDVDSVLHQMDDMGLTREYVDLHKYSVTYVSDCPG